MAKLYGGDVILLELLKDLELIALLKNRGDNYD
jgi:hypothetical protein